MYNSLKYRSNFLLKLSILSILCTVTLPIAVNEADTTIQPDGYLRLPQGAADVTLELISFENSLHRLSSGENCDIQTFSLKNLCDQVFDFCLSSESNNQCDLGFTSSKDEHEDDMVLFKDIDMSHGYIFSHTEGSWRTGRLKLTVEDNSLFGTDLVENFIYTFSVVPGTDDRVTIEGEGSSGSRLTMRLIINCSPNHYGPDCDIYCKEAAEQYSCDKSGRKLFKTTPSIALTITPSSTPTEAPTTAPTVFPSTAKIILTPKAVPLPYILDLSSLGEETLVKTYSKTATFIPIRPSSSVSSPKRATVTLSDQTTMDSVSSTMNPTTTSSSPPFTNLYSAFFDTWRIAPNSDLEGYSQLIYIGLIKRSLEPAVPTEEYWQLVGYVVKSVECEHVHDYIFKCMTLAVNSPSIQSPQQYANGDQQLPAEEVDQVTRLEQLPAENILPVTAVTQKTSTDTQSSSATSSLDNFQETLEEIFYDLLANSNLQEVLEDELNGTISLETLEDIRNGTILPEDVGIDSIEIISQHEAVTTEPTHTMLNIGKSTVPSALSSAGTSSKPDLLTMENPGGFNVGDLQRHLNDVLSQTNNSDLINEGTKDNSTLGNHTANVSDSNFTIARDQLAVGEVKVLTTTLRTTTTVSSSSTSRWTATSNWTTAGIPETTETSSTYLTKITTVIVPDSTSTEPNATTPDPSQSTTAIFENTSAGSQSTEKSSSGVPTVSVSSSSSEETTEFPMGNSTDFPSTLRPASISPDHLQSKGTSSKPNRPNVSTMENSGDFNLGNLQKHLNDVLNETNNSDLINEGAKDNSTLRNNTLNLLDSNSTIARDQLAVGEVKVLTTTTPQTTTTVSSSSTSRRTAPSNWTTARIPETTETSSTYSSKITTVIVPDSTSTELNATTPDPSQRITAIFENTSARSQSTEKTSSSVPTVSVSSSSSEETTKFPMGNSTNFPSTLRHASISPDHLQSKGTSSKPNLSTMENSGDFNLGNLQKHLNDVLNETNNSDLIKEGAKDNSTMGNSTANFLDSNSTIARDQLAVGEVKILTTTTPQTTTTVSSSTTSRRTAPSNWTTARIPEITKTSSAYSPKITTRNIPDSTSNELNGTTPHPSHKITNIFPSSATTELDPSTRTQSLSTEKSSYDALIVSATPSGPRSSSEKTPQLLTTNSTDFSSTIGPATTFTNRLSSKGTSAKPNLSTTKDSGGFNLGNLQKHLNDILNETHISDLINEGAKDNSTENLSNSTISKSQLAVGEVKVVTITTSPTTTILLSTTVFKKEKTNLLVTTTTETTQETSMAYPSPNTTVITAASPKAVISSTTTSQTHMTTDNHIQIQTSGMLEPSSSNTDIRDETSSTTERSVINTTLVTTSTILPPTTGLLNSTTDVKSPVETVTSFSNREYQVAKGEVTLDSNAQTNTSKSLLIGAVIQALRQYYSRIASEYDITWMTKFVDSKMIVTYEVQFTPVEMAQTSTSPMRVKREVTGFNAIIQGLIECNINNAKNNVTVANELANIGRLFNGSITDTEMVNDEIITQEHLLQLSNISVQISVAVITATTMQPVTMSGISSQTITHQVSTEPSDSITLVTSDLVTPTTSEAVNLTTDFANITTANNAANFTTSGPVKLTTTHNPANITTTNNAANFTTSGPVNLTTTHNSANVTTTHNSANVTTTNNAANFTTSGPVNLTTTHNPANVSTTNNAANFTTSGPVNLTTTHNPANITTTNNAANFTTSGPVNLTTTHNPANITTTNNAANFTTTHNPANITTTNNAANFTTSGPLNLTTTHNPANVTTTNNAANFTTSGPVNLTTHNPANITTTNNAANFTTTHNPANITTTNNAANFTTSGPLNLTTTHNPANVTTTINAANFTTSGPVNLTTTHNPANVSTTNKAANFTTSGPVNLTTTHNPANITTTNNASNFTTSGPVNLTTTHNPANITTSDSSNFTTSDSANFTTSDSANFTTSDSTNFTTSGPVNFTTSGPVNFTTSGPVNFTTSGPVNFTTSGPVNLTTSGPVNLTTSGPVNLTTSGPVNFTTSGPVNLTTSNLANSTTSNLANFTTTNHPANLTTSDPAIFTSDSANFTTTNNPANSTAPDNPANLTTNNPTNFITASNPSNSPTNNNPANSTTTNNLVNITTNNPANNFTTIESAVTDQSEQYRGQVVLIYNLETEITQNVKLIIVGATIRSINDYFSTILSSYNTSWKTNSNIEIINFNVTYTNPASRRRRAAILAIDFKALEKQIMEVLNNATKNSTLAGSLRDLAQAELYSFATTPTLGPNNINSDDMKILKLVRDSLTITLSDQKFTSGTSTSPTTKLFPTDKSNNRIGAVCWFGLEGENCQTIAWSSPGVIGVIVGAIVAVGVLLAIIIAYVIHCRQMKGSDNKGRDSDSENLYVINGMEHIALAFNGRENYKIPRVNPTFSKPGYE